MFDSCSKNHIWTWQILRIVPVRRMFCPLWSHDWAVDIECMWLCQDETDQICTLQVHCARLFYENLVPSHTIYDVECPDHSFRKFTEDGHYLISFSRNNQDLIVYRPRWLSFCCKEDNCIHDLPQKAKRFESFFTELYTVSLASNNELICKDFFLYLESNQFGVFVTSTAPLHDAPSSGEAVPGIPSIDKITFHLLRWVL